MGTLDRTLGLRMIRSSNNVSDAEEVDKMLDHAFGKSSVTIGSKTNGISSKVTNNTVEKGNVRRFPNRSFRRGLPNTILTMHKHR